MAKFIPVEGRVYQLKTPLTLTQLKLLVGGEIQLVETAEWSTEDLVVVQKDSWGNLPVNPAASSIAGLKSPIYGNAVVCAHDDIA